MTAEPPPPTHNPALDKLKESLKPQLPKRFYQDVSVSGRDGGFTVLLDGRPVRTPARKPLLVPSEPIANALADEWRAQQTTIDPARMPLTRIVNSALDGVAGREADVAAEIVKYAGNDLLFYRADGPAALAARQAKHWDPVLAWAEARFGGRFVRASGLMPVTQPAALLAAIAGHVAGYDTLRLAALHVATTLTGSALLALAHAEGQLTALEAWTAAHVDEDHQIEMWGEDDEAAGRRAGRWLDMQAASRLLRP